MIKFLGFTFDFTDRHWTLTSKNYKLWLGINGPVYRFSFEIYPFVYLTLFEKDSDENRI